MQLLSKFNRIFRLSLCVSDIYSKHACVIPLIHKKGITIANPFQKNFRESNHKPNKTLVDKGSEFYHRLMKIMVRKK